MSSFLVVIITLFEGYKKHVYNILLTFTPNLMLFEHLFF